MAESDPRYPTISTDFTLKRSAHWHHGELNEVRQAAPFTFNDATFGFWMINQYEHVLSLIHI